MRKLLNTLPDKLYLQLVYFKHFKRFINFSNPRSYNEKLQWLKINNRKPIFTDMVDKYKVRDYVANKIGKEYLIPLVGGPWFDANDIDVDKLPNQFVIKCNHDSGSAIICRDKSKFDFEDCKKTLSQHMKNNLFWYGREWPYKNVTPCIIAEQYLELNSQNCAEYKMFCFNGEVKIVLVCKGAARVAGERTNDFFDVNFNRIPVTVHNPNSNDVLRKPAAYEELLRIAKELSQGMTHVRVDTYVLNDKVYFGELTFFHNAGFTRFNPEEYDLRWGEYIKISDI